MLIDYNLLQNVNMFHVSKFFKYMKCNMYWAYTGIKVDNKLNFQIDM